MSQNSLRNFLRNGKFLAQARNVSSHGLKFFVRALGFDLIFKESLLDYENGSTLVVEPRTFRVRSEYLELRKTVLDILRLRNLSAL